MPSFRKLGRQLAGKVITARTLENLQEVGEFASRARALPPLSISSTPAGPLFRYAWPIFQAYIGQVATGGISARVGTTLGSGNVAIQNVDPSGNLTTSTMTVVAWNITTAMILANKYCVVLKIAGLWVILISEC